MWNGSSNFRAVIWQAFDRQSAKVITVKLVWAIVQSADAGAALKALVSRGYRTTRINTVGGWLKRGNVSLLLGVEPAQVDDVVATLREHCRSRNVDDSGRVTLGRATVFVVNAPGFVQL